MVCKSQEEIILTILQVLYVHPVDRVVAYPMVVVGFLEGLLNHVQQPEVPFDAIWTHVDAALAWQWRCGHAVAGGFLAGPASYPRNPGAFKWRGVCGVNDHLVASWFHPERKAHHLASWQCICVIGSEISDDAGTLREVARVVLVHVIFMDK